MLSCTHNLNMQSQSNAREPFFFFFKCKKAKWLSGEALQIAVKRREVKSKRERERYTLLNAEFQRIARRGKKAFLNEQCKEIEENNRIGRTGTLLQYSCLENPMDGGAW